MSITPLVTYQVLLVVQALHLLHHRLTKRHISYAEAVSGGVLCIPPTAALPIPEPVFILVHLSLATLQVIGSIFIKQLSPAWDQRGDGDPR